MGSLNSMLTAAAVEKYGRIADGPDGDVIVAAAWRAIDRTARRIGASDDAANVARLTFAGWPGMASAINPDTDRPVLSLDSRLSSAAAAGTEAVKRAAASEWAEEDRQNRAAEAAAEAMAAAEAEADRAGGKLSDAEAAAEERKPDQGMAAFNSRGPAADSAMAFTPRDRLRAVLSAAGPDTMRIVRAIAHPDAGRKTGGIAPILRAAGLPTSGRRLATSMAAYQAAMVELRAAAAAILGPDAMGTAIPRGEFRRAVWTPVLTERAAAMVDRPGRVGSLPAWDRPSGPVGPRGNRRPVSPRPASLPVEILSMETGEITVRPCIVDLNTTAGRVEFLAPDAALMHGGPVSSARPVPGVRPGIPHGQAGTFGGEGKAVRITPSRKRKGDGGVGTATVPLR